MGFEVRLKELHNATDSTLRLNPKVIETWINETLKDAEHLEIPGVIVKPEHKNPISRYQIDRLTLNVTIHYSITYLRTLVCRVTRWTVFTEVSLSTASASTKCSSVA